MAKQVVGLEIDHSLWKRFKAYAKDRGMLLSAAVAEALREKLERVTK